MPDTTAARTDSASALLQATQSSPDPVVVLASTETGHEVVWANRAFVETVKAEPSDLSTVPIPNLITCPFGALPLNEHRVSTFPASVIGRDGSLSVWDAAAVPALGDETRVWVITLRPPSGDHQLDDLLRASEERFRALAERAPIGIFSSEVGLRFGYVNDQLAELVGVPAERLLGTGWIDYLAPEDAERVSTGLQATLAREPFDGPARLRTAGGEERWVNIRAVPVGAAGAPAGFLGTVEDVTDRRRYEDLLAWQAHHDPLTRLPNRAKLGDDLAAATARLHGEDDATPLSVLFFDLDDFKSVNDQLGHRAGDQLLQTVAERLTAAVRDHDAVYRFAGDEFVVIAWGARDDREALGMARRLREAVARPMTVEGTEIPVRCSVGVVRAEPGLTPEDLIRDADAAMYRAKADGKGAAAVFDHHERERRELEEAFTGRVRGAIENSTWHLEYLPIAALDGHTPVAVEARIRFNDPERGEIGGDLIVDLADRSGLLTHLSMALVDQVCADLAAWRDAGAAPDWVLMRLTAAQLTIDQLADHVAQCLVTHGLGRTDVRIGVRADLWADNDPPASVAALAELGIGLAVCDVGTGCVSLSELTNGGVQCLAFDARFASGDRPDALVTALTSWAAAEGIDCIGSGIDTPEHASRARQRGITLGSGQLLGVPTIAAAVPAWFEVRR